MLSDRFKTMYRQLGLSRPQAAQLLHVSERTLRNWETGHHEIPYSAYKLLRLLSYTELPGKAWDGWHIAVGQLWSPEGYGFKPTDANWWSNLCRRAELFHVLYKENQQLRRALAIAATPDRASFSSDETGVAKTISAVDKTKDAAQNSPALAISAVSQAPKPPSFAFKYSTSLAGSFSHARVVAPRDSLNIENLDCGQNYLKPNAGAGSGVLGGV